MKKHLRELGVPEWWISKYQKGLSSNRHWRMAKCLGKGLHNNILQDKFGLLNIEECYKVRHHE